MSSLMHDNHPASLMHDSHPASLMHDSHPTSLMHDSHPTSLMHDSHPASLMYDSHPASLMHDSHPASLMQRQSVYITDVQRSLTSLLVAVRTEEGGVCAVAACLTVVPQHAASAVLARTVRVRQNASCTQQRSFGMSNLEHTMIAQQMN